MRWSKVVLLGFFLAALVGNALAGWLTPRLKGKLDGLVLGAKVSVLVHMAEKPRFSQFPTNARREKVAYLKSLAARSQSGALTQARGLGADSLKPFWVFNGFRMKATKEVILAIAARQDVEFLSEDAASGVPPGPQGPGQPPVEWNITQVKAPDVWNLGYRGEGIVLCIFDTGVFEGHETFNHPFSKWRIYNGWYDPVNGDPPPPNDLNGHGTHVAGIAVGGDANEGSYLDIGVAYRAQFIACRKGPFDSQVHAGFQWIASLVELGCPPDVVNCSWGDSNGYGTSLEFWGDVMTLRSLGILPVFAIGNFQLGHGDDPNRPPGNYPIAFGVGATDESDLRGTWAGGDIQSCMGPSPVINPWSDPQYWGRPDAWSNPGLFKPDLGAPGTWHGEPEGIVSSSIPNPNSYFSMSGSSMGAPHVSGALALMLQASRAQWHYDLNYYDLYDLLLEGADRTAYPSYPNNETGWGRLNCLNAVNGVLNYHLKSSSPTATGPNNGDKVAYGGDKWHMVYESGGPMGAYVRYTTSTDDGVTWTQEENGPAGEPIGKVSEGGNPALSVEPNGNAHVIWVDGLNLRYSQKLASSPSWSSPVNLFTQPEGTLESPALVVDPSAHTAHVVFATGSVFGRSIVYGWFDTPNPVLNYSAMDAGDVSHPSIGFGANVPHVAWRKKSSPKTKPAIYYASPPGSQAVQISPSGVTCEHPDMAVRPNGDVCVVWEQGEGMDTDIWFCKKLNGTWQAPNWVRQTSWESRSPAITLNPMTGYLYVSWADSTYSLPDNDWEIFGSADLWYGWEQEVNLSNTQMGSKYPQIAWRPPGGITEGTALTAYTEGSPSCPSSSRFPPVYSLRFASTPWPPSGGGGQSAGLANRRLYRTALLGAYPNPLVGETALEYEIAKPMQASLRIYNVSGQVVRTLVEWKVEPGHYEATWDGKDSHGRLVSSGVYFYRLDAGGFSKTNKLVVVR